jgi:dihydropyrimidinase
MSDFDLIICGGTVAASDTFKADVGIRGGRIVAPADGLTGATQTIRRQGASGAARQHRQPRHIAQPSGPGIVMAVDFENATRSACIRWQHHGDAVLPAA